MDDSAEELFRQSLKRLKPLHPLTSPPRRLRENAAPEVLFQVREQPENFLGKIWVAGWVTEFGEAAFSHSTQGNVGSVHHGALSWSYRLPWPEGDLQKDKMVCDMS